MNKIKIYVSGLILLLFSGVVIISCTKTFDEKIALQSNFSNSSLVQVYMAMVNANRNYVYVDAKPVTGASMVSGSVFPSSAYAASIPGGFRAFLVRDTLSTTTQVPLSFAENMQVGKNYTIFVYDTITTPKQKTIETTITIPDDTTARLRFANFVYNPTVLPNGFDIFSAKRNAVIFSNVKETEVTGFIPYASGVTDTFFIRPAGSPTNLQNWKTTNPTGLIDVIGILTPVEKRSYTIVFRGGYRATATSNTTVRNLSIFVNY
jgi:hypothetical protein